MYEVDFSEWLMALVGLFDNVLSTALSVPIFGLIAAALLFIIVVSLFAWLMAKGSGTRR